MWKVERRMWKVICVAVVLFAALNAQAIEFVQTEQFISSEGEILREETWVSAQTITLGGETSNDLFAIASTIDLDGIFQGDTWGCGDTISTHGIFRNDLRLMSRTAQVSGTLYGSLVAAGNTVKIERTAILHEDLLCLGESVVLEGSVDGNVRIMAQRVTLGGRIGGDVLIAAQDIVVLPGTILSGNLTYTAPQELVLPPSVVLSGELTRTFAAVPARQIFKSNLVGHFLFGFAALITGLVFMGLFPRYTSGSAMALRNSRGICMLIGFVALFMLPVIAFLLLFTFIGTPLSILLILFYLILLYLSKIVVALVIGTAILRRKEFNKRTVAAPLALGLLIIYALTSFAVASMLINILVIISGLGALLIALFKKPVLVIQTPNAINEIK